MAFGSSGTMERTPATLIFTRKASKTIIRNGLSSWHLGPGHVRRAPGELDDGPELKRKRWGIFQGRSAGKSQSAPVPKRRTGTRRKEEATNLRGDGRQEPEMEKEGGQPKQHSQGTQSFGIEAENCSSVTVRRDNPEKKN
ncbi:hypothetical protein NDU88_005064 [Pleurodeles waltl]|uniref:Uncharacterized protein n=1 Tax=Pleurodeles waltl TaxID=8319 RepID=A0AAV7VLK6_PLEWA|nr:hypothetical protein NDU88_005064 [Pleurodeles waltl]